MIRIYQWLLLLYPRQFREEFGEEMVALVTGERRRARDAGGTAGLVRFWMRTLRGLVTTATMERLETPRLRARRVPFRDTVPQDIRFALRSLARRPGHTLAIVSTLAVGIGANSVMFSVVDRVLLGSTPFREPARLVAIHNRYDTARTSSSPPDYIDRREGSATLESVAAFSSAEANLSAGGSPEQIRVGRVTSEFFEVLGVESQPPVRFEREDGAVVDRRAVLSDGIWRRRFGSDPNVVGRELQIDGESFRVAGVMPSGFDYPRDTDVWTALHFTPQQLADDYRGNEFLAVVGRLRNGATIENARSEMEAIAAQVIDRVPERATFLSRNGWGAAVSPLSEEIVGSYRPALLMLWGAVALVLLVACANVANLLLARAESRARELSLRQSLGASRTRLAQQLLTESAALAACGAVAGLGLALALMRSLPTWVPPEIPNLDDLALDGPVLAFTFASAAATALICGLAPAWRGTRPRASSNRLTRMLVVNEVALAVVLSLGAALVVDSFRELTSIEPGFATQARVSFGVTLSGPRYLESAERARFMNELLERLEGIPGATAAAASYRLPLDGETWTATFYPDTFEPTPSGPTPGADLNVVSGRYFNTMGVPLLGGRTFDEDDDAEAPRVVIIDAETAERFWPAGDAVGATINMANPRSEPRIREIVGVVGRVKNGSLDEEGRAQLYFAARQVPQRSIQYVVVGAGDASALLPSARRELAALDPDLPLYGERTLGELVDGSTAVPRLQSLVLGGFALLAVALAALGVYSVLSYSVSARTIEIGTRIALGAPAGRVTVLVLRQAAGMVGPGLVMGLIGASLARRALVSRYEALSAGDPMVPLAICALFLLVSFLAAWIPASRATRIDPVNALRAD